ncbi:hypothetical protein IQ07DRAFT_642728 [Pyrenochaeta sp. DS3sAY3a]|nr:hypothetical protein IQ07DRAFT_642728 [Pyrenochaeta sp. DS3sAY3a]
MSTPTLPTVPFPTPTDLDTDDDDDDDVSSSLPPQPPATSPPGQTQSVAPVPPPENTGIPGQPAPNTPLPESAPPTTTGPAQAEPTSSPNASPSASPTELAESLPSSGVPTPLTPGDSKGGLSAGASAGIGVGVAIVVILMAIGIWIFARRRRRRWQKKRRASGGSSFHGDTPDEEVNRKLSGQHVAAYRHPGTTNGATEMEGDPNGEKALYELATSSAPVEAVGDREFPAELPGSQVPGQNTAEKRDAERLFSDAPLDEQVPVYSRTDKKRDGERLFSDAPLDVRDEGPDTEPRIVDKKG